MLLKQSTAVVIPFGPFVDKTDGVTLEVGLVAALDNATTGIMLSKNGGAFAVRHATVTATTYGAHGCYLVTLDTTDTATLGNLRVIYTDATTCLPVWQDFRVVTANVWDTFHSTDVFDVSLTQILGAAITGTAAQIVAAFTKWFNVATPTGTINSLPDAVPGAAGGVFIAGTNAATAVTTALTANITGNVSGSVGSVTGAVGSVTGAVGSVAANGITATSIAADAINAAAVKADAVTKIQAGLATPTNITAGTITTVTNLTNAPTAGDFTATMKTSLNAATPASVVGAVGSIASGGIAAASFAAGAINAAAIADGAIDAATFAAGAINAAAIATGAIDADALATDAVVEINDGAAIQSGTCQAGSTYNNILLATTASAVNDYYIGCLVSIVGGTGTGQARLIADYIGSTRSAVVDNPWVTAPDGTTLYRVYPFSGILLADTGLAAAAAASTITLATTAPAIADTYVGHTIFISGGTGIGQARIITEYTNVRVATVSPAWTTTPDTTSVYMVLPVGRVYVNQLADGVITAASVSAAAANKVADHTLRRGFAAAAGSSDGDTKAFRSLLGAIAKLVNKISVAGSTLTICEADDSTALGTQTVTTSAAADPITALDTT